MKSYSAAAAAALLWMIGSHDYTSVLAFRLPVIAPKSNHPSGLICSNNNNHRMLSFVSTSNGHVHSFVTGRSRIYLAAATEGENEVDTDDKEEAANEEEISEVEEEEKVEEEDPEITALKEEISKLEADLKSKRFVLNDVRDRADDYTESGYLRKVAEMDNYRKRSEIRKESNRFSSRAAVVSKVLPILDELEELEAKYDPEVNDYKALRSDLENVLRDKLDMTDYEGVVGDEYNLVRYTCVGEEYSEELAKDLIIRSVKSGLEIKGNVLRPAEVVKSLGNEADEELAVVEEEGEDNDISAED